MGKKVSKVITQSNSDLFEIKTADEENKYGIMTKELYQNERLGSKMNVQKDLLYHVLGDAVSKEDIRNVYIFDKKLLGQGHFGYVRRAKFICDASRCYAIKTIPIKTLYSDAYLLKRELEILRLMDHPNIIKFFDYYKDENYLHIVMENCSGGNLFAKLMNEKRFDEELARSISFQVIYAVSHLHDRGICHRDLRLENFFIMNRTHQHVVKLADFGLAKMFSSSELKSKVGAYHYIAPEIFEGTYTQAVDCWSVGVMIYMMLTGAPPFYGKTPNEVYSSIKGGSYSMSQPIWENISPGAKELVQALLTKDPTKRITISKALDHTWFSPLHLQYNELGSFHLKKDLLERFKGFNKISKVQKEVIKLMVIIFHDLDEIEKLKHVFFYLDDQNHGVLTVRELKDFFNRFGEAVSESDIETILKDLNLRFKNSITLSEFTAVTIEPFFVKDEKNIKAVYNRLRAQIPPAQFTLKPRDHNTMTIELPAALNLELPAHLKKEKLSTPGGSQIRDNMVTREYNANDDSDDEVEKTRSLVNPIEGERRVAGGGTVINLPLPVISYPVPKTPQNERSKLGEDQLKSRITPMNQTPKELAPSIARPVKQLWQKDRESEMTGRILGNGLAKFGLLIQAEDYTKMVKEVKRDQENERLDEEISYEEFAAAMTEIFN